MKGRARKPLSSQKGNLNREKIIRLEYEEKSVQTGKDELTKPPVWLVNNDAKKEWKRIVPQLKSIDIIGNLDLANIAGYCNAYAQYRYYTEQIKEAEKIEDTAERIQVLSAASNLQIKYAQELRRFSDMCGISVSSRMKAAAEKTTKKEDKIQQEFGAI